MQPESACHSALHLASLKVALTSCWLGTDTILGASLMYSSMVARNDCGGCKQWAGIQIVIMFDNNITQIG